MECIRPYYQVEPCSSHDFRRRARHADVVCHLSDRKQAESREWASRGRLILLFSVLKQCGIVFLGTVGKLVMGTRLALHLAPDLHCVCRVLFVFGWSHTKPLCL